MSRPLRLEIADGWYHVMNRGLRRHVTFTDDEDHTLFLDTLGQACRLFGVKVGAYCLMPNHYHLLLNTPNANLSRFMRHVNGVYTQRFNRKNGKDGPLFRGRYRALVVDANAYLLQVVRYIHLNPVKARISLKPEGFRWSSHRVFIQSKGAPDWMNIEEVLTWFSTRPKHSLKLYKEFMRQPQAPELEKFYNGKKIGWVLGDKGFISKMKRKIAKIAGASEEITQTRKVKGEVRLETISQVVRKRFKVGKGELMESQRGKLNHPRNVAIYLARELSGLRQREIAEYFGASSYRTIAAQHYRVKGQAEEDKALLRQLETLRASCCQVKT